MLVTEVGGFIRHYLVKSLKNKGYWVRGLTSSTPNSNPALQTNLSFLTLGSLRTVSSPLVVASMRSIILLRIWAGSAISPPSTQTLPATMSQKRVLRQICEHVELEFDEDMLPAPHHKIPLGSRF